jgi:hypothetical protein
MIYFHWLGLVPLNTLITVLTYVLSPVLPLFAKEQYGALDNNGHWGLGPRLPSWLSWFQTPDNSLNGDATFERENPPSYLNRAKWLRRNPGYNIGTRYLTAPYCTTISGDPTIKDNDNARAGWCFVRTNGLFQLRLVVPFPFGFKHCFYWNFGWNIMGLADPNVTPKPNPWEATFACSPRFSGFR